jgi:hypothetical protein
VEGDITEVRGRRFLVCQANTYGGNVQADELADVRREAALDGPFAAAETEYAMP